ncbi:MAG: MBG domain-containing protein, partial [Prevotellaceae bacterium]|nr:MBG domain-containing protein [Prevotellaceae bacterium]
MKKIYQALLLSCVALIALNAKVLKGAPIDVTFGSYVGKSVSLYPQGTAGGNTDAAASAATLDFKVVTVNSKTWAWTNLSNGSIDGNDAWVSQLRFWNNSNEGKRENNLTTRPSATESLGSTDAVPDNDGKISIFQNLVGSGFSETEIDAYNPAIANTPVGEDQTAPTLTTADAENVSQVAALLRFEVTEDNDYFYYVTGENFEEIVFADSLQLVGLTSNTSYSFQVSAVDFSGNVSEPQNIGFNTTSSISLSTPTDISIGADSVISFTGDDNAIKYAVTVYRGSSALVDHEQEVSATGEKLNFGIPGTYTVTVQAVGNELEIVSSSVSEGYQWDLVNDSYTPPTLETSNSCRQPLTKNDVEIWFTVEEKNGQLWVTLEPSTEGDKESRFRAGGFDASSFTLNGRIGTWFTKTENGLRQQVFTPAISLHAGDVINYSGAIEYVVPSDGNAYELGFTLNSIGGDYIWGSHCPRLAAPADITIDANRELTFSGDADAARYAIKIYNDAGMLVYEQNVLSGNTLPFDVPGTFTAVMQSLADPNDKDHFDSDTSLHYTWQLENSGRITYPSGFLNTEVGTGNGRALWTWETVDAAVIVSIAALGGEEPADFRNTNGLSPELFTVNGTPNTNQAFFTVTNTNTTVTLTPVAGAVKLGDVVSYSGMVTYRTAADGNLWPTIDFGMYGLFVYGAKGFTLFSPENISVDANRVLTFEGDDAAGSYEVKIYNEAGFQVATQTVASGGETLIYDVPGSYTLTLQSLAAAASERRNSVVSEPYAWTYENENEVQYPSIFCGFEVNPDGRGDNDKAVFTWETRDGKLVVTITDADGNFDTYFRNKGLQIANENSFKVNGVAGDWFNEGVPNGEAIGYTEISYEPKAAINPGDQITFNGIVEYRTGLQVIDGAPEGLWPTIDFGAFGAFTWGTTCDYYPQLNVNKGKLTFSPDTGVQTFQLSAEKLTSPLIIEASKGLQAFPASIEPNAEGKVYATVVTVTWEEGASSGFVRIRGGGLAFPKEIPVVGNRFSEYCNKVLYSQAGDAPIYLTIAENEDKTELSFTLAPIYGASAQWNDIVNIASSSSQTLSSKTGNGTSTVTATFGTPLENGDVVTFGNALVWTATKANGTVDGNAYINTPQTYTVGAGGCLLSVPHPDVYPQVTSATVSDRASTAATLKIATNKDEATYAVGTVRLRETNGLLPLQELEFAADSLYTLENLEMATSYSLQVTAVDTNGYTSDLLPVSFATRDVLVVDSFEYTLENTLTYDGVAHPVVVTPKPGIAAGTGSFEVKYNANVAAPVNAGDYDVTLEVAQSENFMAATFELGSFTILKAAVLVDSLAYDTTAVTYSGEEYAVAVTAKSTVVGLGDIMEVKYDGETSVPVNAGSYVVTVNIDEGGNYLAATDLRLGTLVIGKANAGANNLSLTSPEATYDGDPQAATVDGASGVNGLGSIASLLYNDSEDAPVNAGKYGITVSLSEGSNYLAGTVALPDSFEVKKAVLTAAYLSYTLQSVQYDGNTHEVGVSLVEPYTG